MSATKLNLKSKDVFHRPLLERLEDRCLLDVAHAVYELQALIANKDVTEIQCVPGYYLSTLVGGFINASSLTRDLTIDGAVDTAGNPSVFFDGDNTAEVMKILTRQIR